MATIIIRPAKESEKLPVNHCKFKCFNCQDVTLHKRVIRDRFTQKIRAPINNNPPRSGLFKNQALWRCLKCGELEKF